MAIQRVRSYTDYDLIMRVGDDELFQRFFPGLIRDDEEFESYSQRIKRDIIDTYKVNLQNGSLGAWLARSGNNGELDFYCLTVDSQGTRFTEGALVIIYAWARKNVLQHRDVVKSLKGWAQRRGYKSIVFSCDPQYVPVYKSMGFVESSGVTMELKV